MQILYLYATIIAPIVFWRFFYIGLVFLPRFHKYLLLIGEAKEISGLIEIIRKKAPDNKVIGYLCEDEIKNAGGPVYLHCSHGRDRSAMVAASYRVNRLGWDCKKAWSEMAKYGHEEDKYPRIKSTFVKATGCEI